MKNICIEGTINFRNLGMEYIYTPIPLKLEFESNTNINIIERQKLIIEVEKVLKNYINSVNSEKSDILKSFHSFNEMFIELFKKHIKQLNLKYLNGVNLINLTIGDNIHSVDGITNKNQIINLN